MLTPVRCDYYSVALLSEVSDFCRSKRERLSRKAAFEFVMLDHGRCGPGLLLVAERDEI